MTGRISELLGSMEMLIGQIRLDLRLDVWDIDLSPARPDIEMARRRIRTVETWANEIDLLLSLPIYSNNDNEDRS